MGRNEIDERQLLSDLSKFIGAAKAAMKAARNIKRAAKPSDKGDTAKAASSTKGKATATAAAPATSAIRKSKKQRRAKRKAAGGATIRITFKGGYSALNRGVPGREAYQRCLVELRRAAAPHVPR